MSNALIPLSDLQRMAQAVASSKLFGIQTPDQALALMLVASAEGLHPATAARDYHIINGRPALKADAMLARYLNSGGKVKWLEHSDTKVAAEFAHPNGGTLTIEWDMERAKKAGLGGKDMWSKYPRQMLRARVISEGIRATNPAVSTGVYTVEETMDMEPARGNKARNMGKAEVVEVDDDDEKLKLIDTDWSAELKKSKTLEELGATWARMPDAAKRAHAEEKDLLKMQFAAGAPT